MSWDWWLEPTTGTVEDAERPRASPRILEWWSRPLPGPDGEWACPLPPGPDQGQRHSQKINIRKTVRGLGPCVEEKKKTTTTRSQSRSNPFYFLLTDL